MIVCMRSGCGSGPARLPRLGHGVFSVLTWGELLPQDAATTCCHYMLRCIRFTVCALGCRCSRILAHFTRVISLQGHLAAARSSEAGAGLASASGSGVLPSAGSPFMSRVRIKCQVCQPHIMPAVHGDTHTFDCAVLI